MTARASQARPSVFRSAWTEVSFVASTCLAQILVEYFVSGFALLIPTVSTDLSIPENSQTWPASSFSLVVACFLLIFGRVTDMYGGKIVYVVGLVWLIVWSLVAGFSTNQVMLNVCRALQGFGPAAFIVSSISILGKTYIPGPKKNLVFSLYGFSAVAGFIVGFFFAGLTAQFNVWHWYFWIGCIFACISLVLAMISIPLDLKETRKHGVKMDYWGAITLTAGQVFVVYALIDSTRAADGWRSPQISVLFSIGVVFLVVGTIGESVPRLTNDDPLIPLSIFKIPSFGALLGAMLLSFASVGILLLYAVYWFANVIHISPLLQVAYFCPLALGGFAFALVTGAVLHVVKGTYLLWFSAAAYMVCPLLFIYAPVPGNSLTRFWAYIFPAMICGTLGIDVTFNVANIFISTSLDEKQQGLAGSLIQDCLELGIVLGLGFAEILNQQYRDRGFTFEESYQRVFWLELGFAAAGFVLAVLFVKVGKQEAELITHETEPKQSLSMPDP